MKMRRITIYRKKPGYHGASLRIELQNTCDMIYWPKHWSNGMEKSSFISKNVDINGEKWKKQ